MHFNIESGFQPLSFEENVYWLKIHEDEYDKAKKAAEILATPLSPSDPCRDTDVACLDQADLLFDLLPKINLIITADGTPIPRRGYSNDSYPEGTATTTENIRMWANIFPLLYKTIYLTSMCLENSQIIPLTEINPDISSSVHEKTYHRARPELPPIIHSFLTFVTRGSFQEA